MWNAFKQEWRKLRRSEPGRRFQNRYMRSQAAGVKRRAQRRVVRVTLGIIALLIGVVLVFIPGPAILFFAVGGGLIASESRYTARFLDWCEVRLRVLWSWSSRRWRGLSRGGRAGVACLAVGGIVAGLYLSYRLVLAMALK